MNATVILHVAPADVLAALPTIKDGADERRAVNGETVRARALEDCVAIDLERSLAEEPAMLFVRLCTLVGAELVALHQEPRGIPAYPTSHSLTSTRWDAIVEELGEAADWIPIPRAPAGMPDLSSMLGPEGAAFAAQLQGPGGEQLMQSAMEMAQKLMAGGDLESLLGGNVDLEALKGKAQQMLNADPDLERRLRDQLGAFFPPEPDEEEGDDK